MTLNEFAVLLATGIPCVMFMWMVALRYALQDDSDPIDRCWSILMAMVFTGGLIYIILMR